MSQEAQEVLIVPSGLMLFMAWADVFGVCAKNIESEAAKNGKISRSVVLSVSGKVFAKLHV